MDPTFISPVSGSAFFSGHCLLGTQEQFPRDILADMLEQQAKGRLGVPLQVALFNSNGRVFMSQKGLCYVRGVGSIFPGAIFCHGKP
ncbi:MAG: hypothetical protein Ct9H90mP8_2760 [Pseudomonadota bacterium]|nr:MAG: hypothetical protein Ct9H90mP8_2760 [Pseudomonadota bacterium]